MQDPFPGRDAAEHLLAARQLVRDDVRHVRVAEGEVAVLDVVLCQEGEESEKGAQILTGGSSSSKSPTTCVGLIAPMGLLGRSCNEANLYQDESGDIRLDSKKK